MEYAEEVLVDRLKIYIEPMNYVGKDPKEIIREEIGDGKIEKWYLGGYPIIEGDKVKLVMADLPPEFLVSIVIQYRTKEGEEKTLILTLESEIKAGYTVFYNRKRLEVEYMKDWPSK